MVSGDIAFAAVDFDLFNAPTVLQLLSVVVSICQAARVCLPFKMLSSRHTGSFPNNWACHTGYRRALMRAQQWHNTKSVFDSYLLAGHPKLDVVEAALARTIAPSGTK